MRGYVAITRVAFSAGIAYRSAYWFGLLGLLFKVSLLYFFWRAVFAQREAIGDMGLEQMAGYVVLSSLVTEFNAFGAGRILSLMVARGEIAVELVRPYSIIGHLLAANAGQKLVELTKSGAALVVVGFLVAPSVFLTSLNSYVALAVAIVLGGVTIQLLDLLIACLAFWTNNTWGLWLVRNSIVALFSGALLPLSLFPTWFQTFAFMLPYANALYSPLRHFLTPSGGVDWLSLYGIQLLWILVSACMAKIVLRLAVRRVEVFGG
ncbi:ABC-2 family transporter protein [Actinomyces sp.]|uniref:ABC transporter permease n=1 Tax=Actinomyces sp. TaxID=29317 RepID=UPI0026DC510B|nr:ABC-2 family transporter protein [Actinomyces sp.]MDO4899760.1 ABC-2 family transporter protein [Actinomyces sp.]